jgi:putative addiction module CopG family antidote
VAKLVESGRYNSKSEALREGLRLVQDREARSAALDASIAAASPTQMRVEPNLRKTSWPASSVNTRQ